MKKLSILIPVYNEESTVAQLLDRVLAVDIPGVEKEVVVVNDASRDRTPEILRDYVQEHPSANIQLFDQEKNQGKGAAMRLAMEKGSGDMFVFQDADLEYDPREYSVLLAPILEGRADVVFGSRFLGGAHRVLFFWHYVGNKFLTTLSNMMTDLNLTDMETCYKAFTREVRDAVVLRSNRFGMEPEFTAKVARNRFRIFEVPISYSGRTYEEGKKIGWKDGVSALWTIIKYRFVKK